MKNKNFKLFVLSLACFLSLVGCSTVVGVSTLIPAEGNINGYKTIAVAPATKYNGSYNYPYGGYYTELRYDTRAIPTPNAIANLYYSRVGIPYDKTAQFASSVLQKAVEEEGFYKIIGVNETSRLLDSANLYGVTARRVFLNNNIDAVISSTIDNQIYEQFITCEKKTGAEGAVTYDYFLNYRAYVKMTYNVQDIEKVKIVDTYSYESSYPSYSETVYTSMGRPVYYEKIFLGTLKSDGTYAEARYSMPVPETIFSRLIDSFASDAKKRLSPSRKTSYLSLMKSDIEELEQGYGYAENDMYEQALIVFERYWNVYRVPAAGYNAAVLRFALGDFEGGIALAKQVYDLTAEKQALTLYKNLTALYKNNISAEQQLDGTVPTGTGEQELIGF